VIRVGCREQARGQTHPGQSGAAQQTGLHKLTSGKAVDFHRFDGKKVEALFQMENGGKVKRDA
jgi:hypothetical protein